MRSTVFWLTPIACAAMIGAGGCTTRVTTTPGTTTVTGGVVVTPVRHVPARIYTYPSTVYEGRRAYLVGDRWYYDAPSGWAIFEREPARLRHYRTRGTVERAPPAPRGQRRSYEPPPARRVQ